MGLLGTVGRYFKKLESVSERLLVYLFSIYYHSGDQINGARIDHQR